MFTIRWEFISPGKAVHQFCIPDHLNHHHHQQNPNKNPLPSLPSSASVVRLRKSVRILQQLRAVPHLNCSSDSAPPYSVISPLYDTSSQVLLLFLVSRVDFYLLSHFQPEKKRQPNQKRVLGSAVRRHQLLLPTNQKVCVLYSSSTSGAPSRSLSLAVTDCTAASHQQQSLRVCVRSRTRENLHLIISTSRILIIIPF